MSCDKRLNSHEFSYERFADAFVGERQLTATLRGPFDSTDQLCGDAIQRIPCFSGLTA